MSKEERINYLLTRCLQQNETISEQEELNHYLLDPELKDVVERSLLMAFYSDKQTEEMPSETKEYIITTIYKSASRGGFMSRKLIWLRWVSAAAIFLFITIPLLVDKDFRGKVSNLAFFSTSDPFVKENEDVVKDILPAQELAVLEMIDGSKVYLPTLPIGEELTKNGLIIKKSNDNELLLKYDNALQAKTSIKKHVVSTPKGGKFNLVLPDGTKVRLNSESKLVIPYSFTDSSRVVELEGEAFFEVVKDKRVFSVVSSKGKTSQRVNVFGTSFNISAYSDNEWIETTLVSGSVNVKSDGNDSIWLKPNESLIVENFSLKKSKANLEKNLAWLNDIFYFEDETIYNVIKQIGRWYDVEFKNVPKLSNQRLWAQVSRDFSLHELLSIIEKTNDVKFKIVGKEVYVID